MTSHRCVLLVALVACGGTKPTTEPPPVVGNRVEAPVATPPPPPAMGSPCEGAHDSLRAKLREKQTGEPMIGATVVATGAKLLGEQVVISDENGAFSLPAENIEKLTIYYNDWTKEYVVPVGRCDLGTIDIAP